MCSVAMVAMCSVAMVAMCSVAIVAMYSVAMVMQLLIQLMTKPFTFGVTKHVIPAFTHSRWERERERERREREMHPVKEVLPAPVQEIIMELFGMKCGGSFSAQCYGHRGNT